MICSIIVVTDKNFDQDLRGQEIMKKALTDCNTQINDNKLLRIYILSIVLDFFHFTLSYFSLINIDK